MPLLLPGRSPRRELPELVRIRRGRGGGRLRRVLEVSPAAMAQGSNRLERGIRYHEHVEEMARRTGKTVSHRLITLAGVGHDAGGRPDRSQRTWPAIRLLRLAPSGPFARSALPADGRSGSILHGKPVENRSWEMICRGPLWLHVGSRSRWNPPARRRARSGGLAARHRDSDVPHGTAKDVGLDRNSERIACGAITALIEATGCHHSGECVGNARADELGRRGISGAPRGRCAAGSTSSAASSGSSLSPSCAWDAASPLPSATARGRMKAA